MPDDQRLRDEQSTRRRANLLHLRYFDTRALRHRPLFPEFLSNEAMYRHHAVVLSAEPGRMIIAITSNTPQHSLNDLEKNFPDYKVTFVMISEAGFKEFMELYDPPEEVQYQDIEITRDPDEHSLEAISQTLASVRSDDILDYLLRQAHRLKATDIHLETQDERVRIRFRVDGVLHDIAHLEPEKYRQLMSSIAVRGNISVAAPNPQTGHISYQAGDENGPLELNMRIETVPTLHGQDVVLRLFNLSDEVLELKRLGLSDRHHAILDQVISHPSGLVLAVGPTGSGKTTTLYSVLRQLNTPDRKIVTLEDPVEYSLPGIVQIPVHTEKQATFADTLRSVLRLDPDVIMIGEIRDVDTARTALQAALSGHLVLSTFHADNAISALSRLSDMVGDNPLFASALRLIIAQRLVRRLTDSKYAQELPEHIMRRVREITEAIPVEHERPNLHESTFFAPAPGPESPFGFSGQIAVMEMLEINDSIAAALQQRDFDRAHLEHLARENDMITLLQDGVQKAAAGLTSAEEIFRVVA